MAPIIGSHATQAASVQVAGRRELPAELAGLPKLIENRVSHIHGLGTFTTAPLQEGQIFWFLDDKKVLRVTKANHDLLLWAANLHPERYGPLCDAMHCYCYYEEPKNALMFILDGGRYLNHSESPTSVFRLVNGYQVTVAARDLPAGTEIVEDYFTYDRAPWCPAPLSEYLVPGLEKCAPSGERPAEGRHTLFELTPEQYAVLKESPLPDGLGRVFFDACVPDEKGGASVFVDI
ncbi:hypothetical protein DFJ74DRAFT_379576 [Hyaloraphidium curvatum]|nr:hypothetical protein DFJ74DRAFT_379576 [Hyaloraphidium curvatum]